MVLTGATAQAPESAAARPGAQLRAGRPARRPGRQTRSAARGRWWPFAGPAILVVLALYVLPLLLNGVLAFTNWGSFSSRIEFTGIDNFETLVTQNSLFNQVRLTIVYAITASVVSHAISLPLALALERPTRLNNAFRAIFFIPVLLSPLAAGYVWAGILDPAGPLSQTVALVVPGFDRAWLGDSTLAIFLVGAVDGWKWSGFFTLIFIAALTTVPIEVKEAARVDGASTLEVFRHVKLPFLAPAFTYNITVTVIGAMSAFDIIVAMTGGGPGNATRVLNVIVANQFGAGYFGLSSATSLVVTALILITAIPLVRWLRSKEMQS